MRIYLILETGIDAVINFEPRRLFFNQKQTLQLFKVVHIFDAHLMFLFVNDLVAGEVRFDHIFKTAVVSQQSQLNDMITELLPLHGLIPIDIHFLEEVDESQSKVLF